MNAFTALYMMACIVFNLGTCEDGLRMRDEVVIAINEAHVELLERGYRVTMETERLTTANLEFFKHELERTNNRAYITDVTGSLVIYLEDLMKSREEYLEQRRTNKHNFITI